MRVKNNNQKHSFKDGYGRELVGRERVRAYQKWYHSHYAGKLKVQKAEAYQRRCTTEEHKEKQRRYQEVNRDAIKIRQRLKYIRGKEKRDVAKVMRQRKKDIARMKERYNTEINFKLRRRLSTATARIVKRGWVRNNGTAMLIGCSWEQLRAHIESRFRDGMDWNNHGRSGWHIDHIKPLASFDFTNPESAHEALNYKNLQPLWWWENLSKSDSLPGSG